MNNLTLSAPNVSEITIRVSHAPSLARPYGQAGTRLLGSSPPKVCLKGFLVAHPRFSFHHSSALLPHRKARNANIPSATRANRIARISICSCRDSFLPCGKHLLYLRDYLFPANLTFPLSVGIPHTLFVVRVIVANMSNGK